VYVYFSLQTFTYRLISWCSYCSDNEKYQQLQPFHCYLVTRLINVKWCQIMWIHVKQLETPFTLLKLQMSEAVGSASWTGNSTGNKF